jgi:hypothetical protein
MRTYRIIRPGTTPETLTWDDAIILYNFADNSFRTIIFIVSILLALLAYASIKSRYAVTALSTLLIVFTLSYSFFMYTQVHRILKKTQFHYRFTSVYYFTSMTIIALIVIFVLVRIDWHQ